MSWLSKNILDPLEQLFAHAANVGGPASQPAASAAQQALSQAATAGEQALENLAVVGANFVLGLLPGGKAFEPLVDEFLDNVIAKLNAAKSTAPPV